MSDQFGRGKPQTLGGRIRALRANAGFSLEVLAGKAGVSTGMISQIERGTANPSLRILECLRAALGVPLTTLLEDEAQAPAESPPRPVIGSAFAASVAKRSADASHPVLSEAAQATTFVRRAESRPRFSVSTGGLMKELLSPHGDHDIQFMVIHIPGGVVSNEVLIGPGEKAGLLLEGSLELTVSGLTETLDVGDSFQFDSSLAHGVRNPGTVEAKVLWIMNTRLQVRHL